MSTMPIETRGRAVVEQRLAAALLDTSVLIDPPSDLADRVATVSVSTISLAELASGLNLTRDPVQQARRQQRYERLLAVYSPVPYSTSAARLYGALCDAVRASRRSPRPRRFDLLLASVAADLAVPLMTRNPDDFEGIHDIVRTVSI